MPKRRIQLSQPMSMAQELKLSPDPERIPYEIFLQREGQKFRLNHKLNPQKHLRRSLLLT